MSVSFNPAEGLVIVFAALDGPSGKGVLRLAVDTGATVTLINAPSLVMAGYDPALSNDRYEVATASGVEYASRITVSKLTALGFDRRDLPILCHTLPPSASVDGVLGLDFFRDQVLTIDFRRGEIALI